MEAFVFDLALLFDPLDMVVLLKSVVLSLVNLIAYLISVLKPVGLHPLDLLLEPFVL